MRPVCDRALQERVVSVFVFPAPRTQPARRWPERPAALAAQGQHGAAAATGPSSCLITQEHAWKRGMGAGVAGEGGRRRAGKRGSEEVLRSGGSEEHLHTDAGWSANSFPTTSQNFTAPSSRALQASFELPFSLLHTHQQEISL